MQKSHLDKIQLKSWYNRMAFKVDPDYLCLPPVCCF